MTSVFPDLNDEERQAVARLTEREREALRHWLDHRTAKQIALDLGVSHYAVEKRLRIARAKLGVTTSIEAARMLEAAEGYKRAGAQAADLVPAATSEQETGSRNRILGVVTMILIATAALAMLVQASEEAPATRSDINSEEPAFDAALHPDREMVAVTDAEIVVITQNTFRNLDTDDSGYLQGTETPLGAPEGPQPIYRRDEKGNAVPTGETILESQEEVTARFYRQADKDGDRRVSYREYHRWNAPHLARSGIPAEWKEDMATWLTPKS